jgi:cytochrome P450
VTLVGDDLKDVVRIEDPDFYDEGVLEIFARMRAEDPYFLYEPLDTFLLTRYQDIREASRDRATFTTAEGVMLNHIRYHAEGLLQSFYLEGATPIMYTEGTRHKEIRRALAPSFTPPAIRQIEPTVARLSQALIDKIVPGEPIEFVSEISTVLTIQTIATLMGFPADHVEQIRFWSDAQMRQAANLDTEELFKAAEDVQRINGYLDEWCVRKMYDASHELLPTIMRGKIGDRPPDYETLHSLVQDVLVAGNETTRDYLSGSVFAYAEHPDQIARLVADPSLGTNAAEECLRYVTPVRAHSRTVAKDTELGGQPMRAGQHVYLLYMSGNRDETVWEQPDRFDITRAPTPANITFGFGEHSCIGAALARLEGRVFFEELTKRFTHWEVAGDTEMPPSVLHNAFERLPIAFTP